jgi:ABC-type sugar transport system permease subunit
MSQIPLNARSSLFRPLSLGNVVTTALYLYRFHFKQYLQQSAIAHLWVLIPLYGWAKCSAKMGVLCRLAFSELNHQPETVRDAHQKIDRFKWSFLRVFFCVTLRMVLFFLVAVFLELFCLGLMTGLLLGEFGENSLIFRTVAILSTLFFLVSISLAVSWIYSRFVIVEVPLAVEEGISGGKSVDRSWELTKSSTFRVQGVVLVGFLLTIPILVLSNFLPDIFIDAARIEKGSTLYWMLYASSIITGLIGNVVIMPFWQVLKAVLYYDLRSRREGLDLNLRDR